VDSINIDVNICGHKPQGLIPSIERGNGFIRVFLDVSKPLEPIPDDSTFAIYEMARSGDRIIGSFKFDKPTNFRMPADATNKEELANRKYAKKFVFESNLVTSPTVFKYTVKIDDLDKKILDIDGQKYKLVAYTLDKYDESRVVEGSQDMVYKSLVVLPDGTKSIVRPSNLYILSKIPSSIEGQTGGFTNDVNYRKYLKYKNKYLSLKNKLNH
jgi:hypothetical protein